MDTHNHLKKGNLALEDYLVTSNPYFRILTTIVGMQVTDLWHIYRKNDYMLMNISVKKFSDCLAYAILEKVQKIVDAEARKQVKKTLEDEKKLKETYKFAQSDLSNVLGSHGDVRDAQCCKGTYSKHHTKCWLHKQDDIMRL